MKEIERGTWHEILAEATGLEPGQIAHFIVAVSTVQSYPSPNFFFATCCDDKQGPTHMLDHLLQELAKRN